MEKKIYNLKKSSLGKVTFMDGTAFCMIQGRSDSGEIFKDVLIVKSIEETLKLFPTWFSKAIYSNIANNVETEKKIIDWLYEKWLEKGIVHLKNEMSDNFGFKNFENVEPSEFINSEPEIPAMILANIVVKFSNGYLKVPVNEIEISIRLIKNILAINFWEDGNPKKNEPQF